jgi:hypothetical protein
VVFTNGSNSTVLGRSPRSDPGGDGSNVRDWLYEQDQIDAPLSAATRDALGRCHGVDGYGERMHKQEVGGGPPPLAGSAAPGMAPTPG